MSVGSSHELKNLQSRRARLVAEVRQHSDEKSQCERKLKAAQRSLEEVDRDIRRLQQQASTPVVTEHAMLRYLERVCGVDLEAIRAEILTPQNRNTIETLETCKIDVPGGVLIVKDRAVVSVEPKQ